MNSYQRIEKSLIVGIIALFLGTSIIPSLAQVTEKPAVPISVGEWLYVGGSGPGNYSNITAALQNASDGDTIYVYSGIYTEGFLEINVSVSLIGQSNLSTIICDSNFWFNTTDIVLTGFCFHNHSTLFIGPVFGNDVSHNTVTNTIFTNSYSGIMIHNSSYNTIVNNQFSKYGIILIPFLFFADLYQNVSEFGHLTNTILNNTVNGKPLVYLEDEHDQSISDAGEIILLRCSNIIISHTSFDSELSLIECIQTTNVTITDNDFNNTIIILLNSSQNIITNNRFSSKNNAVSAELSGLIFLGPSGMNEITNNIFSPDSTIFILNSSHNSFKHNDFYGYRFFYLHGPLILFIDADNTWQRNFWMRPRLLPKLIIGAKSTSSPHYKDQISYDIDWRPTLKPNNPKPEWVCCEMQRGREMSYPWITIMSSLHLNPSYWKSTIPQTFR